MFWPLPLENSQALLPEIFKRILCSSYPFLDIFRPHLRVWNQLVGANFGFLVWPLSSASFSFCLCLPSSAGLGDFFSSLLLSPDLSVFPEATRVLALPLSSRLCRLLLLRASSFLPSMSPLPIIERQKSHRVGLYASIGGSSGRRSGAGGAFAFLLRPLVG